MRHKKLTSYLSDIFDTLDKIDKFYPKYKQNTRLIGVRVSELWKDYKGGKQ